MQLFKFYFSLFFFFNSNIFVELKVNYFEFSDDFTSLGRLLLKIVGVVELSIENSFTTI